MRGTTGPHPRWRRYDAPVAAAIITSLTSFAGFTLAGCSTEPVPTDPSTAPSAVAPAPSGEDSAVPGLPSVPVPEGPYLQTPFGVSLDEPGTDLDLGESAVVAWTPQADEVGVLDLRVLRLEETTLRRSFAGFELTGVPEDSVPYLVTARLENLGFSALDGRRIPLFAQTADGRLVEATPVPQDFEACPGGTLPEAFEPGERTSTCQVYLVPDGDDLDGVAFVPPAPTEPITWTGPVRRSGSSVGGGGRR